MVALGLAAVYTVPAFAHELPSPLPLPDAVSLALAANPDVTEARLKLEVAKAGVREARSGYFPQLRLSSSGGQTNNFTSLLGSGGVTTGTDQSSLLGSTQTAFVTTRLGLNYTVWDWGRVGASNGVADLEEIVAFEEYREARQSVALMVRTAYLALVSARAGNRLAAEAASRATTQLEAARKRMLRGVETELTVLQVESRSLSLAQEARRSARSERRAEAALALLLGGTSDQAVAVSGFEGSGAPLLTLEDARAQALEARPDYRMAQARSRQEGIKLDSEAKSTWPTLALSASGGYVASGVFAGTAAAFGAQPDLSVFGSVSWNLFDGFRADGSLRRAQVAAERVRQSHDRLGRLIAYEIENERNNVLDAAERQQLAEREREVAARALAVAQSRLQKGVATSLDVLDSELALLQAQERSNQAAFDRMLAAAKLSKAIGEDPPEARLEAGPAGWRAP